MADTDWYRKSTWTEDDQAHFFQKLKRARPWSRSQYLRIQAHCLQKARIFLPAIALLEQFVSEYPDDAQLAATWTQMAECKRSSDDISGAVEAYRRAVAQMRIRTNVKTSALQDYPLMVAMLNLKDLFDEAKALLSPEAAEDALLSVGGFKLHAARALILASEGDHGGRAIRSHKSNRPCRDKENWNHLPSEHRLGREIAGRRYPASCRDCRRALIERDGPGA